MPRNACTAFSRERSCLFARNVVIITTGISIDHLTSANMNYEREERGLFRRDKLSGDATQDSRYLRGRLGLLGINCRVVTTTIVHGQSWIKSYLAQQIVERGGRILARPQKYIRGDVPFRATFHATLARLRNRNRAIFNDRRLYGEESRSWNSQAYYLWIKNV